MSTKSLHSALGALVPRHTSSPLRPPRAFGKGTVAGVPRASPRHRGRVCRRNKNKRRTRGPEPPGNSSRQRLATYTLPLARAPASSFSRARYSIVSYEIGRAFSLSSSFNLWISTRVFSIFFAPFSLEKPAAFFSFFSSPLFLFFHAFLSRAPVPLRCLLLHKLYARQHAY